MQQRGSSSAACRAVATASLVLKEVVVGPGPWEAAGTVSDQTPPRHPPGTSRRAAMRRGAPSGCSSVSLALPRHAPRTPDPSAHPTLTQKSSQSLTRQLACGKYLYGPCSIPLRAGDCFSAPIDIVARDGYYGTALGPHLTLSREGYDQREIQMEGGRWSRTATRRRTRQSATETGRKQR